MIRFIVHDGENQTGKHLQPNREEQSGDRELSFGMVSFPGVHPLRPRLRRGERQVGHEQD